MLIVNDNLIDFSMDKKFETLAELYNGFWAFMIGMQSLHKAHSDFIRYPDNFLLTKLNDEAIEFCLGILYTAFCLEYIDGYNYRHFVCVLSRYKSFYVRYPFL